MLRLTKESYDKHGIPLIREKQNHRFCQSGRTSLSEKCLATFFNIYMEDIKLKADRPVTWGGYVYGQFWC